MLCPCKGALQRHYNIGPQFLLAGCPWKTHQQGMKMVTPPHCPPTSNFYENNLSEQDAQFFTSCNLQLWDFKMDLTDICGNYLEALEG